MRYVLEFLVVGAAGAAAGAFAVRVALRDGFVAGFVYGAPAALLCAAAAADVLARYTRRHS